MSTQKYTVALYSIAATMLPCYTIKIIEWTWLRVLGCTSASASALKCFHYATGYRSMSYVECAIIQYNNII